MFGKITATFFFFLHTVKCTSRHALSRKHQRTVRHTGHYTTASPW